MKNHRRYVACAQTCAKHAQQNAANIKLNTARNALLRAKNARLNVERWLHEQGWIKTRGLCTKANVGSVWVNLAALFPKVNSRAAICPRYLLLVLRPIFPYPGFNPRVGSNIFWAIVNHLLQSLIVFHCTSAPSFIFCIVVDEI